MQTRTGLIWGTLLVTIGLTWQTMQQRPEGDFEYGLNNTTFANRPVIENTALATKTILQLQSRAFVPSANNLFDVAVAQYKEESVDLSVLPQVSSNIIPPLPFKYIGRWQDASKQRIMLEHQGEVLTLKEGDEVGDYQLVNVDETLEAILVEFIYRPLNEKQMLKVGMTPNE